MLSVSEFGSFSHPGTSAIDAACRAVTKCVCGSSHFSSSLSFRSVAVSRQIAFGRAFLVWGAAVTMGCNIAAKGNKKGELKSKGKSTNGGKGSGKGSCKGGKTGFAARPR